MIKHFLAGISFFVIMFLFGLVIGGDIGAIGFGFIGLVFGGVVWAGGSEDD